MFLLYLTLLVYDFQKHWFLSDTGDKLLSLKGTKFNG